MRSFTRHTFGFGNDNGNFFEIVADHIFQIGPVQTGSGMVHSDTDVAIFLACAAMNSADFLTAKEFRHRIAAQRHDHMGLNSGDLAIQIVVTGSNLFRERIAIVGGTTFDNVGNKDIGAFQIDTSQEFIQELSGRPHKGTPLSIFLLAGSLSNEEDFGMGIAFTWDSFRTTLTEITL